MSSREPQIRQKNFTGQQFRSLIDAIGKGSTLSEPINYDFSQTNASLNLSNLTIEGRPISAEDFVLVEIDGKPTPVSTLKLFRDLLIALNKNKNITELFLEKTKISGEAMLILKEKISQNGSISAFAAPTQLLQNKETKEIIDLKAAIQKYKKEAEIIKNTTNFRSENEDAATLSTESLQVLQTHKIKSEEEIASLRKQLSWTENFSKRAKMKDENIDFLTRRLQSYEQRLPFLNALIKQKKTEITLEAIVAIEKPQSFASNIVAVEEHTLQNLRTKNQAIGSKSRKEKGPNLVIDTQKATNDINESSPRTTSVTPSASPPTTPTSATMPFTPSGTPPSTPGTPPGTSRSSSPSLRENIRKSKEAAWLEQEFKLVQSPRWEEVKKYFQAMGEKSYGKPQGSPGRSENEWVNKELVLYRNLATAISDNIKKTKDELNTLKTSAAENINKRNELTATLNKDKETLASLLTSKANDQKDNIEKLRSKIEQTGKALNLIEQENLKITILEKHLKTAFEAYGGTMTAIEACSKSDRCQFNEFKPLLDKWNTDPSINASTSKILLDQDLRGFIKEARYQQNTEQLKLDKKQVGERVATLNTTTLNMIDSADLEAKSQAEVQSLQQAMLENNPTIAPEEPPGVNNYTNQQFANLLSSITKHQTITLPNGTKLNFNDQNITLNLQELTIDNKTPRPEHIVYLINAIATNRNISSCDLKGTKGVSSSAADRLNNIILSNQQPEPEPNIEEPLDKDNRDIENQSKVDRDLDRALASARTRSAAAPTTTPPKKLDDLLHQYKTQRQKKETPTSPVTPPKPMSPDKP